MPSVASRSSRAIAASASRASTELRANSGNAPQRQHDVDRPQRRARRNGGGRGRLEARGGPVARCRAGAAHDQPAGAERRMIEHPAEQPLHQVGVVGEQAARFFDRQLQRHRRLGGAHRLGMGALLEHLLEAERRRVLHVARVAAGPWWPAPGRRAGGGRATAARRLRRACGRDRAGPDGRCARSGTARRSRPRRRGGSPAGGWRSPRWAAARATARAASRPAGAGRPASTTPPRRRASRARRGGPARARGRRPASAARGGRPGRSPPPTRPRRRC